MLTFLPLLPFYINFIVYINDKKNTLIESQKIQIFSMREKSEINIFLNDIPYLTNFFSIQFLYTYL